MRHTLKTTNGKESRDHLAFKKIAIDLLKDRGFTPGEIHEEYGIEYQVNGHIKYQVDVAAIRNDQRLVAIECGSIKQSKLLDLRKIFDEVIVIDVDKVVGMYEQTKSEWRIGLYENQRWVARVKRLEETENHKIAELEDKIGKLTDELSKVKAEKKTYEKVLAKAWQTIQEQPSK